MARDTPSTEERRRLYEAVVRVKELALWGWMTESDGFGVQDPETGEHYAMSLYLGPDGLHVFRGFEEMGHTADPEGLLPIPQLVCAGVGLW